MNTAHALPPNGEQCRALIVDRDPDSRQMYAEFLRHAAYQVEKSRHIRRRTPLSKAFNRHTTVTPALSPPTLVCPSCDTLLVYQDSHIGGVSEHHREQWDYFECPAKCGRFQFRQRTRKL